MTATQAPDTTGAIPTTALSVADMAAVLGVTPRRIRQMREDGELLSRGRGLVDASHGVKSTMGSRWLGPKRASAGTFTKAAAGWLMGYQSSGVTPEDLNIWLDAAAGWKLNESEAIVALLNAVRLLGENCPTFESRPSP